MAKILIVDDNALMRSATRSLLETQLHFEVCGEAKDGFDALAQLEHLHPDLILVDFVMPSMNGLQLAQQLRAKLIGAPVILFTNYADAILPRIAESAGVSAVVSKSNVLGLRQQIESLLEAGPRPV